ncbi:hypothetical protein BZG36_04190 [Bifiguratus adelaidae]|uniref:AAA+ ATPase domain-containing protein n=1 Tax=Bifiguratus adelaidae TaxID=1938954 RepID=A0A261XW35_9FUNG|nr:hypothetical protein BZG36_04190 [Bifiguratus adelaidae]
MAGSPVVEIQGLGAVRGSNKNGVNRYYGVPYAKPVVRWRPPVALDVKDRWDEVRDASSFGPMCPQPRGALNGGPFTGIHCPSSEEHCLNMNIYVPGCVKGPGQKLPVMVWVHGGSFRDGSASADCYEGTNMTQYAAQLGYPIVLVGINYRVNVFGFFASGDLEADVHKDANLSPDQKCVGNWGLLDQKIAFEWVSICFQLAWAFAERFGMQIRKHIGNFGGDPSNVTAFGESAGSITLNHHLLIRAHHGIFDRIIMQSGTTSTTVPAIPSSENYERQYHLLLEHLGIDDGPSSTAESRIEALRKVDAETLAQAAGQLPLVFAPTLDGVVIQEDNRIRWRNIANWDPNIRGVMLGTTKDEGTLFTAKTQSANVERYNSLVSRLIPQSLHERFKKTYRPPTNDDEAKTAADRFWGDAWFRTYTRLFAQFLAKNLESKVYYYNFNYPMKSTEYWGLDIHHAIELPFLFLRRDYLTPEEQRMGETLVESWVKFAYGKDLKQERPEGVAWPPYSDHFPVMIFDTHGANARIDAWDQENLDLWIAVEDEGLKTYLCRRPSQCPRKWLFRQLSVSASVKNKKPDSTAALTGDQETVTGHDTVAEGKTAEADARTEENTQDTKTRRGRKGTKQATLHRYRPVIPETFLKTNLLRHEQLEGSFLSEYRVPPSVVQEVLYTARGSLVPSAVTTEHMVARTCHLLLNSDKEGTTYMLDALVKDVAKDLGADILTVDLQDLMLLTTNVFTPRSIVNPWPFYGGLDAFNSDNAMLSARIDNEDGGIAEETLSTTIGDDYFADENEYSYFQPGRVNAPIRGKLVYTKSDLDWLARTASKLDRFFTALLTASPRSSLPVQSSSLSTSPTTNANVSSLTRPKILYVREIGEIVQSHLGTVIIASMVEAVQRAKRKGHQLIILASQTPPPASASTRGENNATSKTVVTQLSELTSPQNSLHSTIPTFATIHIPCAPTALDANYEQDDQTKAASSLLDRDIRSRIQEINGRNVQLVTIHKGFSLPQDLPLQEALACIPDVDTKVWDFARIHRLIVNALGYAAKEAREQNTKLKLAKTHFQQAYTVISQNATEHTKLVGIPDLTRQKASLDAASLSQWLQHLKEGCDRYEMKLLPRIINPATMTVTLDEVRVKPATVDALYNIITLPLLQPDLFRYGVLARHFIPGVLLFGPPGTGKTMLAKAVAKESGSSMIEVRASEVYDMYIGEGEKNVRAIFSLARKLAPCVVFVDEVDFLFNTRRSDNASSTAHREVINQFMVEWDGLSSQNQGVLLMAATNRPFDLDDAVLRRMPRRILVDLPSLEDRKHILQTHLKDEDIDISLDDLAQRTEHFSGSDLKNLCVAAALSAVREQTGDRKAFQQVLEPASHLPKRILRSHHFSQALSQITPSSSDDMASIVALRKWDEQYGDGAKPKKKPAIGFGANQSITMPAPNPSQRLEAVALRHKEWSHINDM